MPNFKSPACFFLFIILNTGQGTAVLSAQTNLNLEIWGSNNLNPAEWATANALAQIGTQTTFKETANPAQGLASAKMVTSYCNLCSTFGIPFDTVAGIIVSGDTASGVFGIPYTQTPQYLSFRYWAMPQPGDAGIVAIQLTYYDTLLDSAIIVAEGIFLENNVVSNWTDVLLPIQYYTSDTPDTLIIASSSSASFIFSGSPAFGVKQIGSEFYADTFNIHFSYPCSFNTISITVNSTDETSPGANDGSATAIVSGGFSPFTFLWNNAETTDSILNLSPATYTVTVTDSIGCTVIDSAVINAFSCTLSVNATSTDETFLGANDGTATAVVSGGTSPYSYSWSNGETFDTILNLSPGIYSITVTDSLGCIDSATVTVNSFSCSMTVSATSTDETFLGANDGTATAVISGGTSPYSYSWNNGGTFDTIINLSPAIYSITVTDSSGCMDSTSVTVNAGSCNLSVSAASADETASGANDGSVSAIASGGNSPYFYLWNTGDTTSSVSGLPPSAYSVTITDNNGCTDSATTIVNAFVCTLSGTASATDETSVGANDGTATVNVFGGNSPYTYSWSNGVQTQNIASLTPGIYSVTVTDSANCTITDSATVNAGSVCGNFTISNILITEPNCSGGSDGQVSVNASGGAGVISYTWSNGNSGNTAYNLFGDSSYSVTATDVNSCTEDTTIYISQPLPLAGTISHTDETCANCQNGTVSISAAGGTPPYSYLWTNNETSPSIDSLAAGIYSVIIQDLNGCYFTAQDTVKPAVLEIGEFESSDFSFEIYPNPNDGKFVIRHLLPNISEIKIYNLTGEKVFQSQLTANSEQLSTNLPNGIYFVKIENSKGKAIQKIIVE